MLLTSQVALTTLQIEQWTGTSKDQAGKPGQFMKVVLSSSSFKV